MKATNWETLVVWAKRGAALSVVFASVAAAANAQSVYRSSSDDHVAELARYLDRVQVAEPVAYRSLAVYPILLKGGDGLRGGWLTLDEAVSQGDLEVTERGGGGSVPAVLVHNRSRSDHFFIMSGEVLSGGKQTRTVRQDVVLAPGQEIELKVYCVEARRWEGDAKLSAGKALLPQSIQQELRRGADQQRIWSEVARNNKALSAENATGSLERALKSAPVQKELREVRTHIMPRVPRGTMGFIFVDRHRDRAVGADFFGRDDLARELLPKLLESYAVDLVVIRKHEAHRHHGDDHDTAIDFFEKIRREGSSRTDTPGSGAGIRTRSGGLLGDGVSLGGTLVHYGVQTSERIVPKPDPKPIIIFPQRRQQRR
jgi:hypothetical protein